MWRPSILILAIIWGLVVVSFAGPRWVGEPLPLMQAKHQLMLVLDLSPSMAIPVQSLHGYPVNRLDVAKHAAEQFVSQRETDQIGLIVFGTKAYLLTPLTYDHVMVQERLQDVTVGLMGQSTALGDALGLAVKRLQDAPPQGRVIVLLTDGANNAGILQPLQVLKFAKQAHIKIYTVGFSQETNNNDVNMLLLNWQGASDLDEASLKKIAHKTHGRYFKAVDLKSLQAIYTLINQLETAQQASFNLRPEKEYYLYPLLLALLLGISMLIWICISRRRA